MFKMKKNALLILMLLILIAIPISFASDVDTDLNSTNELTLDESNFNEDYALNEQPIEEQNQNDDAIYVSQDGDDENNGNSTNPIATIKKAIELSSNSEISQPKIVVKEGTYIEYGLNIVSSLELEADGEVIISGNLSSSKASRIITIDTTDEVKISGITFENGRDGEGGAIYINQAKVIIENCKFINNTAVEGGAIYWNGNEGTLINSYFSENRARKSGSAVCWGGTDENSDDNYGDNGLIVNITLENNNNANTGIGECMGLAINSNNVKILNSSFINNNGKYGTKGGSLYISGANVLVDNCLFENNTMDQAPAIQCDGDNTTISNSKFINNTINSTDSARGGAIDIQGTNTKIYNNIFVTNGGEKCYNGGAISIYYIDFDDDCIINITNNQFINNSAVFGAGIFINGGAESYCEFKQMIIDQNIFDGNEASTTSGIYVMDVTIEEDENISTVIITNNEFKNLVSNYVSAIFIDSASVRLGNNSITNCTSLDENNHIYNNGGYISGNLLITVNNNDTIELLAGKHVLVNATLVDDMGNGISGGNITFIIEGQYINEDGFESETGTITLDFYSTEDGIYNISADYLNGDKPFSKDSIIISLPYDILINVDDIEGFCEENILVPIQVGVNGEEIDGENISITFNEKTFNETVNNGIAIVNITLPEENGNYTLTVTYDIKNVTKNVVVKDNSVKLFAPDVKTTPNTGNLIISLKDAFDSPLSNENITVSIDGNEKTFVTNSTGEINVPLDLKKGVYDAKIVYKGGLYKASETHATINVDYIGVLLSSSNIKMNYKDGTAFIVRLTDSDLNPIINQNLTITISKTSKTYVTDENGIVSLLINSTPGSYVISTKYDGDNKYYSNSISNTITVKSLAKLTGKNLNMYFADQSKYKVRLFGDDGKAVGKGKIVKITINGKTYKVKTDKNGYASLKISLKPKTYTVKATYGKLKVTNKVVVKPILSAKNISKKKAKTIKFQAKLAKGKKALANKKIKFKIKKKTYTVKTNKKGIATVNLKNLKVGKYTIYTYYSTCKIKNTIKIKK